MVPENVHLVFDSLTAKQHATLSLASRHLTSKQIAIELGVAPITIDKRIEAVRAKLGSIPRPDLLRLYGDWCGDYGETINGPIILPQNVPDQGCSLTQPDGLAFAFEDSLHFDARASWDRNLLWLRPGLKPSDLGVAGKLLVMLGGAAAIMVIAVLSMAFANAVTTMITS